MAIHWKNALKKYGSPTVTEDYMERAIAKYENRIEEDAKKSKFSGGFIGPEGMTHVNHPMTDFSLKYRNGAMIADLIAPRVPVSIESDTYYLYGRQDFRLYNDIRANGTVGNTMPPPKVSEEPPYKCVEHQLQFPITDRDRRNADSPLNLDFDTVENITNNILLNREVRVAGAISAKAKWLTAGGTGGVTLTGAEQFDNASFDPNDIADRIEAVIDTGKEAIRKAIGRDPNVIVIPRPVARVVKRDDNVRNLLRYTDATLLRDGELPAQLWDMDVFEPGAIYDSAEDGQAFSGSDVWGKNIVLLYLAENPRQIKTMSAIMTFMAQPRLVRKWRDETIRGDQVEVSEIVVEKLVSQYCGYVIENAIA